MPTKPSRAKNATERRKVPAVRHRPSRAARLEARLPADVHALLKRAAEIEGRTLTDFVVTAARAAARRTIEETQIIRLSLEDQRAIMAAVINPPEPTPALRRAFQLHRKLIASSR
jgi:uncharacterized protein (DUF1778 family)